ncbi:hypothetical protein R6Q59_012613, partial [Mikania micrantha]
LVRSGVQTIVLQLELGVVARNTIESVVAVDVNIGLEEQKVDMDYGETYESWSFDYAC